MRKQNKPTKKQKKSCTKRNKELKFQKRKLGAQNLHGPILLIIYYKVAAAKSYVYITGSKCKYLFSIVIICSPPCQWQVGWCLQSTKHSSSFTAKQGCSILLNNWSSGGLVLKHKKDEFKEKRRKKHNMAPRGLFSVIWRSGSSEITHWFEKTLFTTFTSWTLYCSCQAKSCDPALGAWPHIEDYMFFSVSFLSSILDF